MTRYEYMKNIGLEKLAQFLCDMMDSNYPGGCGSCPAEEHCSFGHNGFIEWLKQEMKTDD